MDKKQTQETFTERVDKRTDHYHIGILPTIEEEICVAAIHLSALLHVMGMKGGNSYPPELLEIIKNLEANIKSFGERLYSAMEILDLKRKNPAFSEYLNEIFEKVEKGDMKC